MNEITMHYVKSVRIDGKDSPDGTVWVTFTFTDEKGNQTEVTAFGKNKISLMFGEEE